MLANCFGNVGALVAIVVHLEKLLTYSRKYREIAGKSYEKPFLNQPHLQHAQLEFC